MRTGDYTGYMRVFGSIVLIGFLLVMVGRVSADLGWYDSNWGYRKKITIYHTKVEADLTDFQILISLSSDTDLANDAQDDGDDILFTSSDSTTKLRHEIEEFNGFTGKLVAWVRIPILSGSQDTEIYMYYGNSGCSSQQDGENVWDSNYKMVQHLNESCASSSCILDSTSNNNDGTPYSDAIITDLYTSSGKINGANEFDGIDDYIDCGSDGSLDITDAITVEAWVKRKGDSETKSLESILIKRNMHLDLFSQKPRFILGNGANNVDTTADITFQGGADDDHLGISVSSAGDVNGDGYKDIIVGAYRADGGGTNRGQAYIYYGGSPMDNIADVTFTGLANNDYLGTFSSSAGDVNGDGYDDVIIGAPFAAAGGIYRGQAYIYYGGSPMDNIADVTFTGGADSDELGCSVASAGDVNGDGYNDVIIGAWKVDAGGTDIGEAYIYYGGTPMDSTADITFQGIANSDYFGRNVASAGDVNSDGYDGVIVGAFCADAGGTDRGEAYLYQSSVDIAESPTAINNDTWHHLAGTFDGSNVKIFLDGVLKDSIPRTDNIVSTTADLIVGISIDFVTREFNGGIDEVRISDVARSGDWIKTCWNNQGSPSDFYIMGSEEAPPNISSIPTLTQRGMIIFSILLFAAALWLIRKRKVMG